MEEKKSIKISISTFFLLLAIVVIIVMGVYICKLDNEKKAEIQKSLELQAQVSSLNMTSNNLQSKLNIISKTLNSTSNVLSESEALAILKSKFDIVEKIYFSPNVFFNVNTTEEINNFENDILKYGTDNLLNEIKNNLPMCIRLNNGKYYYYEGGGSREYVGFDSFENIKITDSKITATLKTKQSRFNGTDWVSAENKSSEFTLVKMNNEWLIDKFNSKDFN